MQDLILKEALLRLGRYRALAQCAIQFNSIVFRVVVGVTGGLSAKSVTIVTIIEFFLNSIFEVPTGRLADRVGRVRLAIIGMVLTSISGIVLFLAIETKNFELTSLSLLIGYSFLMGIAKPMMSGSVEAYYQNVILFHEFALSPSSQSSKNQTFSHLSFTLSNQFGKYLTTFAVFAAFLSLYWLDRFGISHYTQLIGSVLWLGQIWVIRRDALALGETRNPTEPSGVLSLTSKFVTRPSALYGTFLNTLAAIQAVTVLGYLMIALGRERHSVGSSYYLELMGAFMIGYVSLGWILKSHILPSMISKYSARSYLLRIWAALGVASFLTATTLEWEHERLVLMSVCFFGCIFQVTQSAVRDFSTNCLLVDVAPRDFATVLSISNVPFYGWIGLYSLYLAFFTDSGVPKVSTIFYTCIGCSIVGILVTSLYFWKSQHMQTSIFSHEIETKSG